MLRSLLAATAALVLVAVLSPAKPVAGDNDPPEPRWRRAWLHRGAPMTKRIAAVLDVSGSMRGRPLQLGRQELVTIFGLFPDDGWARVYRFADTTEDFGGWRRLPDAELLRDFDAWLSVEGTGNTHIGAAVAVALSNEQSDLSVILVSDGDASAPNARTLGEIEAAQKARKQGPAPIHVIAVWEIEPHHTSVALLDEIAKRHGGAMVTWRLERPEPAVATPR